MRLLTDAVRRTRVVRAVLVLALLGLGVSAALIARGLDVEEKSLFKQGTSGVVVLDLSRSVGNPDYLLIRETLSRLIAADAPLGVVIFSDVAYELIPPGSPASALKPILRLFTPAGAGYPPNPWNDTFRSGTRISTGLQRAREMIERDRASNGSILLVSDLETAPNDIQRLTQTLADLRRTSIPVRVVPLFPTPSGRFLFETMLGRGAFVEPRAPRVERDRPGELLSQQEAPGWLLGVGGALLVLLAVYERLSRRLAVPRWREGA